MQNIAIYSADQLSVQQGVKAVVYGRPGVGKTRLAITAPRPLVFSAERGLLSLRGHNIAATPITNLADLQRAHDWALGHPSAHQFDTFILDSITEIAEVVLASEMKSQKDPRKAYGNMADAILTIFRNFRDYAHKHVLFITHQEYDKDENGMMLNMPSFPGKQATNKSPYLVDEVFKMFTYTDPATNVEGRYFQCQQDNQNIAKDRSGKLSKFEPADLSYVFGKILA